MNPKLLLKTLFLVAIASLLVLMGMNNRQDVELSLPPILKTSQKFPAAIMYLGFVAVGFISGTVATAGGKRGGGKSKSD
jgi:uncharacterized integral membrane protein